MSRQSGGSWSWGGALDTLPARGGVSHDAPQDPFITLWRWHCTLLGTVHHKPSRAAVKISLLYPGALALLCCLFRARPPVSPHIPSSGALKLKGHEHKTLTIRTYVHFSNTPPNFDLSVSITADTIDREMTLCP